MLQYLHVKNLALIDEIEVEFGRGLNILTGETGAGKSIILGSVNLALGGRYTKDILRQGARYGLVELTFSVENERQIRKLKELDIYPEDGFITLQRRLMEGRSVSKINGETVQMATLKAVSSILIDIHGQREHQAILKADVQEEMLDSYAMDEIYISLDTLVEQGYLQEVPSFNEDADTVDYEAVRAFKEPYLKEAFSHFKEDMNFVTFSYQPWMKNYALFKTFKKINHNAEWTEWPEEQKNYPLILMIHSMMIKKLCFLLSLTDIREPLSRFRTDAICIVRIVSFRM